MKNHYAKIKSEYLEFVVSSAYQNQWGEQAGGGKNKKAFSFSWFEK